MPTLNKTAAQLNGQPGLLACLAEGLNRLAQALLNRERAAHLAANPNEVANGYAPPRTLHWRTVPSTIAIVRAHALLALGITLEGRKEILAVRIFYRPETPETRKASCSISQSAAWPAWACSSPTMSPA